MFKNLTSGAHWSVTQGSSEPLRRGKTEGAARSTPAKLRRGFAARGERARGREGAREAHRAPGRHGGEVSNGGEVLGGVCPVSYGSGVGPWMIPTIPSLNHHNEHGIGSAMT